MIEPAVVTEEDFKRFLSTTYADAVAKAEKGTAADRRASLEA